MSYIQGDATITFLFKYVRMREELKILKVTTYSTNLLKASMGSLLDFVEESMH